MPSRGHFPRGHFQPTPYSEDTLRLPLCGGKDCARRRTTSTYHATWEYQDTREAGYAVQAFVQGAVQSDLAELLRNHRTNVASRLFG